MNKPLPELTISELKEEFIHQSHILTAAIQSGAPTAELDQIRTKMIELVDQLHNKALELKSETQK